MNSGEQQGYLIPSYLPFHHVCIRKKKEAWMELANFYKLVYKLAEHYVCVSMNSSPPLRLPRFTLSLSMLSFKIKWSAFTSDCCSLELEKNHTHKPQQCYIHTYVHNHK